MSKSDIIKIESGEQISQPVLSIRTIVAEKDLPDHVVKSYERITSYLNELGIRPNGPPFLAYYNIVIENSRGDGTWDLEVGFPVSKILPDYGLIKKSTTVKGKFISCFYKGAYSGLSTAYSELSEWLVKKKYRSMNISYEYFYNLPNDVPEEELLTRVVLLIE